MTLRRPPIRETVPPGVVPSERRTSWKALLDKPTTPSGAGIAIALSDIPSNASATRKFLESASSVAPAWSTLTLADLPPEPGGVRKFLRSVSNTAAVWDTMTAVDIGAGTFPAGAFAFPSGLLLGANSPDVFLTVRKGVASGMPAWSAVDVALFENVNGTSTAVQILAGSAGVSSILAFSNPGARNRGSVSYNHSTDVESFSVAGATKAQLDNTATAGQTALLLFCVDTGTVSRVRTTAAGVAPGITDRTLCV